MGELTQYELWHSEEENSHTFCEAGRSGEYLLPPDARCIWRVEVASWEEAQSRKHDYLGWEDYCPMETITFYKVSAPYGWMSNFAPYPIELEGKVWPTSEHYFQASKFPGSDHAEAIRQQRSPMIAARMGRSRQHPLRADWEDVKEAIMRAAVLAKFSQHADLRALLLETGDAPLVEHTANDSYWANGGDGNGLNRLGVILMEVRQQLRSLSPGS